MKHLLITIVALLMVGCGEEAQKKAVQNEAKDDPSVPLLIPCEACGKDAEVAGSNPVVPTILMNLQSMESFKLGGQKQASNTKRNYIAVNTFPLA